MGDIGFDPRFDERAKEQQRLQNLTTTVEKRMSDDVPEVYLPDYEGYGFVSGMSDRSDGGGLLVDINGVPLKRPVDLLGGQPYMFENPGQTWASGKLPVRAIMMQGAAAKALTGKDPLFLPWRMAPTGSDFAHMTGETMLSFAESNMGKSEKKKLDAQIKNFIPDWKGVDSPDSISQYRKLPDAARKALKDVMDTKFRNEGGLGIGEARLAIADPSQLNAPEGYLMNVGRIFVDKPIIKDSGHPSYPWGVPGEGIGRIPDDRSLFELKPKVFPVEKDIRGLLVNPETAKSAYETLPDVVTARGIPDPRQPRQSDTRALQMKPYYGIITEELLRKMGYRQGGMVDQALVDKVNAPAARAMLEMDLARLAVAKDKMQPKKMAKGGIGKVKAPKVNAPAVVPRSTLTELQNYVREREGGYGAARLERAADEIPNLEKLYTDDALLQAFSGNNARAVMTLNPADFEKYAAPLPEEVIQKSGKYRLFYEGSHDDYIKELQDIQAKGGFSDVPYLHIDKQEQGLPLTPFISGHEGRHRNRAMSQSGVSSGLVQLLPLSELRDFFPRKSQQEFIEALKKELEMTGNKVKPQTWTEPDPNSFNDIVIRRPEIDLPDIYAKGGRVTFPSVEEMRIEMMERKNAKN